MSKMTITAEPGKQFVEIERIFDAPRDRVFKVITDPQTIPHWWGPRRYTTVVDKMEVRAGGQWRFVQHNGDKDIAAFHGVYHDITVPSRTVQTFEFEGVPGHVVLETSTLEALPDGKTRMTTTSVFQCLEDRDGMLASGMEEGAQETWERLNELLKAAK
jgi:uncharacterized protein YndB with AHSA1/START domain